MNHMTPPARLIEVRELYKSFTLHTQGGVVLSVLRGVELDVDASECVVLHGESGAGKSTLMRCLYANYRPQAGRITVRHHGRPVDIVSCEPRQVLAVRRSTIGYVSQFLRVIPRVPAVDVVAEPLRLMGVAEEPARERARAMLARFNLPERLWSLPPATFSGGEQQRVNLARGFVHDWPVLLLDEPTASLDADNRDIVIEMVEEMRTRGTAIIAICHDAEVREAIASRLHDMRAEGHA